MSTAVEHREPDVTQRPPESGAAPLGASLRAPARSAAAMVHRVVRPVLQQGREVVASFVRYATNHIIAHIPSYTVRHAWYRRVWGWQIGRGASVLMGQRLVVGGVHRNRGRVTIGEDSVLNHGCMLMPYVPIRIGSHVSISAGVSLVTGGHDIDDPNFAGYAAPITVEDYVWIGMNATILGGVTIGKGAVVATGALVAKDVPPFAVVAGSPARVIKRRKLENPAYQLAFRPLFE